MNIYLVFVELTKAFDMACRADLWKLLTNVGCQEKFIPMIKLFHTGMKVRVVEDGDYSEPFPVSNGVKQGCALSPTLFNTFFSCHAG